MEKLIKISDNIFYTLPADNDRPACGIVVSNDKALLIDAGNSPAHATNLLCHLNMLGFEQPDWTVITHWHWDHIFGLNTLKSNIIAHSCTTKKIHELSSLKWDDNSLDKRVDAEAEISFCRDNIKLELPSRNNLRITSPNISFENKLTLNLGDSFVCNIIHVGGDHSEDSSVIYIPKDRVMFLGDCLYSNIYTDVPHYTSSKLLNMLQKMLEYDTDIYIESHSNEPVSSSDILAFASLAEDIIKSACSDKLTREIFPLKSKNKYTQNILDAWDFFLQYK